MGSNLETNFITIAAIAWYSMYNDVVGRLYPKLRPLRAGKWLRVYTSVSTFGSLPRVYQSVPGDAKETDAVQM